MPAMRIAHLVSALVVASTLIVASVADAQIYPRFKDQVSREVFHELVTLPYYGVFDQLGFEVDRGTVTLTGQVRRPTLKRDAENVVKRVRNVEQVVNEIEVLPVSPSDDRIRLATYRAIYGHDTLQRYAIQAMPPIHILVKNGRVTLVGWVGSKMDKTIASMQARGVSGVFEVTDQLQVEEQRR
ncbi:MAG: BON domain-containing protein [Luteitalea sp.]|nr:BON domain-containing protein [Luteitalea sp.]